MHQEKLREVGLFSLNNSGWRRDLISVHSYLMWHHKENGVKGVEK